MLALIEPLHDANDCNVQCGDRSQITEPFWGFLPQRYLAQDLWWLI